LHFVSDRTGWWNLYAWRKGQTGSIAPMNEECAVPQWVFGLSTYAFTGDGEAILAHQSPDGDRLAQIKSEGKRRDLDLPYTSIGSVQAVGETVCFTGASAGVAPEVVQLDLQTGHRTVLRRSIEATVDQRYFSKPEAITFATGPVGAKRSRATTKNATVSHALFYPPANPDFTGPAGEKPPLVVISHGGPTSATGPALNMAVQFWTSRGFGVVDVNYRGSSGYGRTYRNALRGAWGIADVEDCVAAAKHLAGRGDVDGNRLIIRGGSAGGYTTLCALAFTDVFAAGASYYGVADAETLARDTHKFESRYLDGLIGPYPAAKETYRERSPIHFADRISCPVVLFQGLEDEIVPPSQAEAMTAALRAKRLPFAYVPFEGEQHGFRKAENIVRSLEAELYFYGRVFKFQPADAMAPVMIEGM
jgi:dipeptidyl aminopeptidase/acylaminoacyl peptidase